MRPKVEKGYHSKSTSISENVSKNREIYNFSKGKFLFNREVTLVKELDMVMCTD